ncbi:hypothetical protein THAOC_20884 [Thalassiosira oceanica]|uniref:Uncharacterized protein n=1 Tax=Thalassiosira oceanica TaxID=159749 RepID=K0SKE8_THAOC|nr:hypothetical protein THAOC_20884 [Thalassiosira oceanica]|eukprot:EJK58952.1 hypothetical protein THAOC_20884 [Thalassiosira oceanica]
MEESRKRAKASGDDGESVDASSSQKDPPASEVVDAAMKIAELQARMETMRVNHELEMDELKAQCKHEADELRREVRTLQSKSEDLKSALQGAYAIMAIEDTPFEHWRNNGYDAQDAVDMQRYLGFFKETIQSLRLGTVSQSFRRGSVCKSVDISLGSNSADHDELLLPYWKEFAAALKHWSEYHSDGSYLEVSIQGIEIPREVLDILRPAFEQSRIKEVFFCSIHQPGDMADFVQKVLQTNHGITGVSFNEMIFAQEDVKRICSAIKSSDDLGRTLISQSGREPPESRGRSEEAQATKPIAINQCSRT